nr:transporter associated domain-containing protein [Anaerostipes caccae]
MNTIAEELGVEIPDHPDYDTLGGLVFSRLHSIPHRKAFRISN